MRTRVQQKNDGNEWSVMPKYKPGETVYLKEPYFRGDGFNGEFTLYRFDGDKLPLPHVDKWKNKLFMPESAARYFIKITGVRAERLQCISEEDCLKEGIVEDRPEFYDITEGIPVYGVPEMITELSFGSTKWFNTPHEAYAALIDSINGKGTWKSNLIVWVYDYELSSRYETKL